MLDKFGDVGSNDIAIVGMALRVPGARNINDFWSNLRQGVESIRDVSAEELAQAGEKPDRIHLKNYVRRTADLPDMEMFDAEFFGLSPKEAAVMDPQHRHFLECAWEALEDAGINPDKAEGPVGVFAGCGMGSYFYFNVCSNRQLVDQVGMFLLRHTGNDKDFLATRTSFSLNLHGPSINIQTACSTSLVAIHYACQSLLNGECDAALAGGVTIEFPHRRGYLYQQGEILSPDGHCRPFDHRAAGTVFGSGAGVVALRRATDAIRDNDVIHAIIKATAVNNDGASKASYLAPSVTGQAEAIIEAQGLAGISADSVQYVECHGTGTPLGDPIEIRALTEAFRQSSTRTGFCHIGSVKSNIGHLDTAAGVVGLIKATLALKHGEIPPTVGFERPNEALELAKTPFVVADRLVAWPEQETPRRAAINSLGVGGTNAHAILQEAPRRLGGTDKQAAAAQPLLLLLSSRQKKGLGAAAEKLAAAISQDPTLSLADVGHTLLTARKHFEHRLILSVSGREDAIAALSNIEGGRAFIHFPVGTSPQATFLFSGGGVQHPGMAADLYRGDGHFRASVDEGLSYLPKAAADDIRAVWFAAAEDHGSASKRFLRPSLQLPAILIVEVAMARLWIRRGVRPAAMIGHSMGENAAACIAGVFSFSDAVKLVRLRGELFDSVEPGGMLSVSLDAVRLRSMLPADLDVASINAPELCVVSGRNEALDAFQKTLSAQGIDCKRVPIDIAAHSRMLDFILPRFRAFLQSIKLRPAGIPIVSNRTGDWLSEMEATDPEYWVSHLRSTVLFAEGISLLAADRGRVYVDLGPGRTLSSLIKQQGTIEPNRVINSLPHVDDRWDDRMHVTAAFGRAWATGLPVDLEQLWEGTSPQRVTVPTYAFQHQRYFVERNESRTGPVAEDNVPARIPDIADWGYKPAWKKSLANYIAGSESRARTWLVFLDDTGLGRTLSTKLRASGHRVVTVSLGDAFLRRSADEYVLCPELGKSGYLAMLRGLAADGAAPTDILHMWLVTKDETFRPGSNFFHRNQECGFYSLLYLAQSLGELDDALRPNVIVLTDGMQRVADEAVPYPEKSTVLGPALVLPKEMAGTSVKAIDLPRVSAQKTSATFDWRLRDKAAVTPNTGLIDLLWEDLLAEPANEIVAYRNGTRWSRVYSKLPLTDAGAGEAMLRHGGVYMLTGGLGELALEMAGGLALNWSAKLVLVGRTRLPARAEWDAYARLHPHDPVRRAISAIRSLENLGAEVLYLAADVSNPNSMRDVVAQATLKFGALNGVFHTAGVVDDDLMQMKTQERIDTVLAPKTLGTAVLNEVLADVPLDFFVMFSSTSTDTAPAGQADYVAANAYLNAVAESAAGRKDRKTIALHWGVWSDIGLAARALDVAHQDAIEPIAGPARGPIFERWAEDESGAPWLETTFGDDHWMFDEHRLVSGLPVLPGTGFIEMMLQVVREYELAPSATFEDIQFIRPLIIPAGTRRVVRARLETTAGGHRILVTSTPADLASPVFELHAEGQLVPAADRDNQVLDIDAIRSRCGEARVSLDGQSLRAAQEDHIRFGKRWGVLKSVAAGNGEALAELELTSEGRDDVARGFVAHPALLDIATGFAIELAQSYGSKSVLWAPLEYGLLDVCGPLPEKVVSWVRLADSSDFGDAYAAFDITIVNPDGRVLIDIERFLMKRLADDLTFDVAEAEHSEPAVAGPTRQADTMSPARARFAAQVRNGISRSEGFDLLMRAMGSAEAQPIVTSMDLEALRKFATERTADTETQTAEAFDRPNLDTDFVEPRNAVEVTIAGFWQELLGVAKVGIHDNFFDLGGHSLIAVRLFRMIKKRYDVDFPISVLFEAPTIAKCAVLIPDTSDESQATSETEAADTQPKFTHLVMMHGAQKQARPLFICAGMFGNILNLRHLALILGQDRPVYGLQARGLYGGQEPHETFEEMARDYIAEIRMIQPEGPYLLAGYSGGGLTAYEIARQLKNEGQKVDSLMMIDTPLPTQPGLSLQDRLTMKLQDLRRHKASYFMRWVRNHVEHGRQKRRDREVVTEQASTDQLNSDRIGLAFRRALPGYNLHYYEGDVQLFRPKPMAYYRLKGGRILLENRNIILPDNGWTPYLPNLKIIEVPGDHDNMVLQPNATVLAEWMRRSLAERDGQSGEAVTKPEERAKVRSRRRRVTVPA
ncbi:type I polyketide synthase [Rhizobium sp. Root708]|uniref:type I polyketide synthase n=1 Tax=Rhizobium sp. Root708 TaxID=1736592 RepID=UPI0009E8D2FD|nr:type I polyketide synthase [Rhizobium sp. Root708]